MSILLNTSKNPDKTKQNNIKATFLALRFAVNRVPVRIKYIVQADFK